MNAITPDWLDVGALSDLPVRGGRVVRTPRGCIAVFRAADDTVFALDDSCPHRGGPLSDGIVHGHNVTCPLHSLVISLETGEARNPDEGRVRTHGVRVEAGRILLDPAALRS
jgi:nitrite reductase (NADH) small subunit